MSFFINVFDINTILIQNLRKNPEIRETLGGATPGSFNLTQGECSEDHKLANARCFATVSPKTSLTFYV